MLRHGDTDGIAHVLTRRRGVGTAAALTVAVGAAWLALLASPFMAENLAPFLAMWTLMMTAMMLPSVAPLVALYAGSARPQERAVLVLAYLGVWSATGLVAYAVDMRVDVSAAIVLFAAAAYELTPLKATCLQRCRAPVDFLVVHWHRGRLGALRLGIEHGAYCIGCCWALMAVLVLAASMSLVWAAALALVVLVQKVLPAPRWSSTATAFGLAVAGLVAVVR